MLCLIIIFVFINNGESFAVENSNYKLEPSVIEKLKLADKVKRSDPKLMRSLIGVLKEEQEKLSAFELDYFKLLSAYAKTYAGFHLQAELILKELLALSNDELIKFRTNYLLVYVMAAQQKWGEGLIYVGFNLNSIIAKTNPEHRISAIVSSVIFYNQIAQYKIAKTYLAQLDDYQLSETHHCFKLQLKLEIHHRLMNLKSNNPAFDDGIKSCKDDDSRIMKYVIYSYKALTLINENKSKDALELLLPLHQAINMTQYPMLIAEINNIIAKAYWQLNKVKMAKKFTIDALTSNPETSNLLQGVETYALLYKIAKKEQNMSLALRYLEKYAAIEKSHLEGEKAKHLAFQLAKHKAYEQENQIKLLNEKNNALAAQQALAKARVENIQLFITILTIAIALFLLWAGRLWNSHKRVKQLAEYDTLTGIFSRGHFTQVTTSALSYCKNAQQPLSLIMFDLDFFKKVNDSFGHACGDWVLKEVVRVCQATGRTNDIFARVGGEEFCLVLPSCQINSAIDRAETCRTAIESINTSATGHNFSVSASFGVTDVKNSGYNITKLLADADLAMYRSKQNGRNKVTKFQVNDEILSPTDKKI